MKLKSRRNPLLRSTAVLALTLTGLVAAVATPVASAQDVVDESKRETHFVTFYGHVFSVSRADPMPMNVEYPYGEEDLSQGLLASNCHDAIPVVDGGADLTCEGSTSNELWLYSTAGFVDITDYTDFSYEKVHNERGLTKDTYLDKTKDVTATLYMSADGHGWPVLVCSMQGIKPHNVPEPLPCWNWDPGYLPQWVVQATVYAGVLGEYGGEANTAPDIASAVESGQLEIIAQGQSTPQDITSLEALGFPTVWKFDVNLGKPFADVIPKEKSYLVRFKWWSEGPGGRQIASDDWNVNTGELYPPSVTLPVKNAFDVESVIPQFVHDKLVVLGIINTPWGSYDVDQTSVKLSVATEGGAEVVPVRIEKLADYSVAHGGHYKPVNVTYVWDYKGDQLPPGKYVATVSASNFQNSASSACSATFEVLAGGAPGPITVSECAVQTLSGDQLRQIQDGASEDASGDGGASVLPPLGLNVASTGAAVVPTVGALPLLVGLAAVGGLLALRRRCA